MVISFSDGEVLHAETPELSFDQSVLEAEPRGVEPNTERALFPLTAIRMMVVGQPAAAPADDVLGSWDRAAFHFSDGYVLRASIRPDDVRLGRHGGVWSIVEQGSNELRTIAIPYAALKGVYRIRQWDSRPMSERSADGQFDQLARILAERELNATGDPAQPRRALLARIRRSPGP